MFEGDLFDKNTPASKYLSKVFIIKTLWINNNNAMNLSNLMGGGNVYITCAGG